LQDNSPLLYKFFVQDRLHDGGGVKAILVKDDLKKDLKHLIWKGD